MKLAILVATGYTSVVIDATTLSTMRVGPRTLAHPGHGFEFGRPVDFRDAKSASQEVAFIQRRYLQGDSFGSEPGMSLPFPGMSLPFPGMSLPTPGMSYPAMSLPYPGMSIPDPGMSLPLARPNFTRTPSALSSSSPTSLSSSLLTLSPTSTSSPTSTPSPSTTSSESPVASPVAPSPVASPVAPSPVASPVAPSWSPQARNSTSCVARDSTATMNIDLQLEVDSWSQDSESFLGDLTQGIVSYGELYFSLCHKSGARRLSDEHVLVMESDVTGFEAQITPLSADQESCTPATLGASCIVVDLVLTVFSGHDDTITVAAGQVQDEVSKHLEAGGFLVDGIIALRLHQSMKPTDSSVHDGTNETPQGSSSGLSTLGTAVISVLSVLAVVSALVVLAKRKPWANRSNDGGDDSSKCDSSTITDESAQPTVLDVAAATAAESPQSV